MFNVLLALVGGAIVNDNPNATLGSAVGTALIGVSLHRMVTELTNSSKPS